MDDTKVAALLAGLLLIISATNVLRASAQERQQQREADWLLAPSESCQQLKIVRRQAWGAKRSLERLESFGSSSSSSSVASVASVASADGIAAATATAERIPNRVFIHQAWDGRSCADIDSCSIRLQAIQAYHQHSKGWPDISYNFLISADGTVYEGIGFTLVGFHTLDYNYDSLGIAFVGTFQDIYPTSEMEKALQDLLDCGTHSNYLSRDYMLHGHQDARCTICPGQAAYERISQMAHFRPGPLARYSCPLQVAVAAGQPNDATAALSSMMLMRNNQQQAPTSTQVLNINSNNRVMVAAVASGGANPVAVKEDDKEGATIVGVFQRKRSPSQLRESHSEKSLFGDELERDDGDVRPTDTRAPLNKGSKDQVILVNIQSQPMSDMQRQQQPQQLQPVFYLLTTKSISKTAPILLISPVIGSSGQSQSSAGDSMDRDDGITPSRAPTSNNMSPTNGPRGNSNRGAALRPSQGSPGAGIRGGGGTSNNNNNNNNNPINQETDMDDDQPSGGGGGLESRFRLKVDAKPISLLDKLLDFDLVSNISSKLF